VREEDGGMARCSGSEKLRSKRNVSENSADSEKQRNGIDVSESSVSSERQSKGVENKSDDRTEVEVGVV